jgi:hypothetical protein
MAGFAKRILGFLVGEDEAFNALGGGNYRQTISGTIGRACGYAGGKPHWWGPICRFLLELMPWFGKGHCERQAIAEANIIK